MTEPIHPDDDCDDETYLAGRAEKWGIPKLGHRLDPWQNGEPPLSRRTAMTLIGEVLYAAKLPDGIIKIGHTTNLLHRFYNFQGAELLAIKAGSRDDEKVLHQSLAAHLHRGHEYYNPTPEVMALVNDWRSALGLEVA